MYSVLFIDFAVISHKEPGGVLVFLPGQDDIEALQSLLEDNLPGIVGQQYEDDVRKSGEILGSSNSLCQNENIKNEDDEMKFNAEEDKVNKSSIVVGKKGLLVDFEIRPLYAAMPPEEQVRLFHLCLCVCVSVCLSVYLSCCIAPLFRATIASDEKQTPN